MTKIKLKGTLYSPKNKEIAVNFFHFIKKLNYLNLNNEAQILMNLRNARSNYLWALSKKSRGGNPRIGSNTKSFRNAKKNAKNLYDRLVKEKNSKLLMSPNIILLFLRSECSCIT